MLSLQSQLCAIRGAFHLCFKRNKTTKKKNKFIGLKVFLTMLVLSLHNPQTCWALNVCSSLPKHSAVTAPNHLEATVSIKRRWEGEDKA